MNLPNWLTLSRISLVPIIALVYLLPGDSTYPYAGLLFVLAAFTDWLDGYLARRLGQITAFGAFLDPIADKLIVVSALILLISQHGNAWLTVPGIIIVGREIAIVGLREWMATMNQRGLVAVSILGKVKTVVQMVAIAMLLASPPDLSLQWVVVGYSLMYLAALMTLWSGTKYVAAAWPTFRFKLKGDGPAIGGRRVT